MNNSNGNNPNNNNGGNGGYDASQNNNNNTNPNPSRVITAADIPLALKARYFGSGMVVGVFVSPLVKKAMAKVQPRLDGILDALTGQAEGFVEKSSDLVAKAKDILRRDEETGKTKETHEGEHEHTH